MSDDYTSFEIASSLVSMIKEESKRRKMKVSDLMNEIINTADPDFGWVHKSRVYAKISPKNKDYLQKVATMCRTDGANRSRVFENIVKRYFDDKG